MKWDQTRTKMEFSHSVGYRGKCGILGATSDNSQSTSFTPSDTNMKYLLCTGGNISLSQDPIMGTGVWGAGYKVASAISYAWNYLSLQGSANFELTTSGELSEIQKMVNTWRTSRHSIKLYPDGVKGFFGGGWYTQCSFQASQGAAVTGSFGFKGDPGVSGNITTYSTNADEISSKTGGYTSFAGAKLIPYWDTGVVVGSKQDYHNKGGTLTLNELTTDIINWNCSCNGDIQMLKCCNNQSTPPKSADYILCGQTNAEASFTVFRIKGQFNPNDYHTELKNTNFYMGKNYVQIPKLIINNASTSMTTGASYVTAEFSYNAVGDGVKSVFYINPSTGDNYDDAARRNYREN